MARVNVPLVGDLAIIQGETYQALSLEFPGDLTDWIPRGQIRTKLLGDAGTLLAAFSFATPAYDEASDTTTIYPRLTPAQTAAIPKTKWQGTGEYSKTAVYYYDIELESDTGDVVKSVPAIVQVVGEVTGPGIPSSSLETFLTAQNNLSDLDDPAQARENLGIVGLSPEDYATAEQGLLAETALQPDAISNFETTTQLNARDTANRDRVNHTGTQSINTVSGLQTALDSKAPINNPTFTGNALILPNNSRINGFEHFYQSTKPTVRGNGSALTLGDRWWKTDDGTEWYWNGTYWLSTVPRVFTLGTNGNVTGGSNFSAGTYRAGEWAKDGSYLFDQIGVTGWIGTTGGHNETVYRQWAFYSTVNVTLSLIATTNTIGLPGSAFAFRTTPLNHVVLQNNMIEVVISDLGSPNGNGRFTSFIRGRLIAP